MKSSRLNSLKLLALLAGLAGLGLRFLIENHGIDGKGLLTTFYPAWVGLWVLTAAVGLVLILTVRPVHGPTSFRGSFPGSIPAAAGCLLAGVTALGTARDLYFSGGSMLYTAAAALAAISFAIAATCRFLESRPGFMFNVFICIYYALEMLRMYQTWSFDPQLHEYCFQLFACIGLTMTAYQLACFGASRGRHRMLWFWGLAAVFLCCVCLDSGPFYLTGAVWAITNLSNLKPPRRFLRQDSDQSAE